MKKVCSKCGKEKELDLFVVVPRYSDGHGACCKECHNAYNREVYHKDLVVSREKARKSTNAYYKRYPERHGESFKRYVANNPDKRRETERRYRLNNPEKVKRWKKADTERRRDAIRAHDREYAIKNREKINEKNRIRRNSTPQNKLKHNLRNRIRFVLKGLRKGGHLPELVGCTIDFLKSHLESMFKEGMSWTTYGEGGWVVDHKLPIDAFDLTNDFEQKACFNWRNLQPLTVADNARKKNHYNEEELIVYLEMFKDLYKK